MINKSAIQRAFTDRLGWHKLNGLPGEFSVSPDEGSLKRVFSSDIKIRHFGRMLLGVIGIYHDDSPFQSRLGLSAYITNFDLYSSPPVLDGIEVLEGWIDRIAEGILYLPSNSVDLRDAVSCGRFGPFDVQVFIESTPWSSEFLEWVDSG